jgi:hypothetical protein
MPWSEKSLALESLVMLAAARLFVTATPSRSLVSRIGGVPAGELEPAASPALAQQTGSPRVGRMIERVARITWWRSMCLEKALACKWMLRRRGIPSTMYVGMAKQNESFAAHAWLVAEGQIVTGGGTVAYVPLAAFREPQKSGAGNGLSKTV